MKIEVGLQGKIDKKLKKNKENFRKYVDSDSDISISKKFKNYFKL